jgi:hypothetical protein
VSRWIFSVKDLLAIPSNYAVAAVVPLGEPIHQPRKLTRKPLAQNVTRERFDGPQL